MPGLPREEWERHHRRGGQVSEACVRACVRVCVRACVHVCARVWECVYVSVSVCHKGRGDVSMVTIKHFQEFLKHVVDRHLAQCSISSLLMPSCDSKGFC